MDDNKEDPLHAINRAVEFCKQYNIKRDDPIYEKIVNAYIVGYHNGLHRL